MAHKQPSNRQKDISRVLRERNQQRIYKAQSKIGVPDLVRKNISPKAHWENIYTTKQPTEVSWYKTRLDPSLKIISKLGLAPESPLIDIGAGASNLADDLLRQNFQDISVLDISSKALEISKRRLGPDAMKVTWLEADITNAVLPKKHYDLWHDRAVFHFLTGANDKRKYVEVLKSSLKDTGHLVIATFNLNGPLKCSGLDIVRYSPETLSKELGGEFKLIESFDEAHQTPFHTVQNFVYGWFEKSA